MMFDWHHLIVENVTSILSLSLLQLTITDLHHASFTVVFVRHFIKGNVPNKTGMKGRKKTHKGCSDVIEVGLKGIVVLVIDGHRTITSHADKVMDFCPLIKVKGYLMFLAQIIGSFKRSNLSFRV